MADFATLRRRMVDHQIRPSAVTDPDVIQTMLAVPRHVFVAEDEIPFAYAERELLMSAKAPERRMLTPINLARLIQALPLGPEANTMVVGCGSGCSAAVLAHLSSSVVAVEEDPALLAQARECLAEVAAANVTLEEGKLVDGWSAEAPYDAILVEGAIEASPDALISQLKPGGMLAAIQRSERISRAMIWERVGDSAANWPQFEAWATLLPGFDREAAFVF